MGAVRPQSDPGPGTRLVVSGCHTRRCPSALRRGPTSCGCVGRDDGGRLGGRMHSGRRSAARIRNRTSVEANPLWIHERNCADRTDQSIAQALRLFDRRCWTFARNMGRRGGDCRRQTNWTAFAIGAGTLAVILLLKSNKRVPGILIAVVGATVIVGTLDLASRADVSVLGPLPQGLPAFTIPWITRVDIVPVLVGGCAVALVSFADTSVLRAPTLREPLRRRPESGNGRTWGGRSGRRILSRLSDQQ